MHSGSRSRARRSPVVSLQVGNGLVHFVAAKPRPVVCENCGEERPAKLGYFHLPDFDYVRIEACDTCKHYIKGIDLTKLGLAAPLVDEIYSAPLDLWARAHG